MTNEEIKQEAIKEVTKKYPTLEIIFIDYVVPKNHLFAIRGMYCDFYQVGGKYVNVYIKSIKRIVYYAISTTSLFKHAFMLKHEGNLEDTTKRLIEGLKDDLCAKELSLDSLPIELPTTKPLTFHLKYWDEDSFNNDDNNLGDNYYTEEFEISLSAIY